MRNRVFQIQKRVKVNYRTGWKETFKKLGTLILSCQFIYSLVIFLIRNYDKFSTKVDIYLFNSRNKRTLHENFKSMSVAQTRRGILIFKHLPEYIKE